MRYIRFNIASLRVTILIVGFGFAALRESSDVWNRGLFAMTLAALLISILLAIHRAEKRRAFWLGFALFGWGYLGLSVVPSIESRLITTNALAYLDSKVPGRFNVTNAFEWSLGVITGKLIGTLTGDQVKGWSGTTENFIGIGHSLFALLAGWLGGQLLRSLCRASRQVEDWTGVESGGSPR